MAVLVLVTLRAASDQSTFWTPTSREGFVWYISSGVGNVKWKFVFVGDNQDRDI